MPARQEIRHTPELTIRSEEELKKISEDLERLRRHDRVSTGSWREGKKHERQQSEAVSHEFKDMVVNRQWTQIAKRFHEQGVSSSELLALSESFAIEVSEGDFKSVSSFVAELRVYQAMDGISPNFRTSKSMPMYAYWGRKFSSSLVDIALSESSESEKSAKFEELSKFKEKDLESEKIARDHNFRARHEEFQFDQRDRMPQYESEILAALKSTIRHEISQEIREIVGTFGVHNDNFADFKSEIFQEYSDVDIFKKYRTELKERLTKELLGQYHSGSNDRLQALKTLVHLDPELALSEGGRDQDSRKAVVIEIGSSDPELLFFFIQSGQISQQEVFEQNTFALANPDFVLLNHQSEKIPESHRDTMIKESIEHGDIALVAALAESDYTIRELIGSDEKLQENLVKRAVAILGALDPDTRVLSGYALSQYKVFSHPLFFRELENAIVDRGEVFLNSLPISTPLSTEDGLAKLVAFHTDLNKIFRKHEDQSFEKYPKMLAHAIVASGLINAGQDQEAQGYLVHHFDHISGYFVFNRKMPEFIRVGIARKAMSAWGLTNETLGLIYSLEIDSKMAEEDKIEIRQALAGLIDKLLTRKSEEAFSEFDTYNVLLSYAGSELVLNNPELKAKFKEALLKDNLFLESLLQLDQTDLAIGSKYFDDTEAQGAAIGADNLADKIDRLRNLSVGRSPEFISSVFSKIIEAHPGIKSLKTLSQYLEICEIFGDWSMSEESIKLACILQEKLTEQERATLTGKTFWSANEFEKKLATLHFAKLTQQLGVSSEDSLAWAERVCKKYEDRSIDSSVDPDKRQKFISIDSLIEERKELFIKYVLENRDIDWEKGAPVIIDQLIGSNPKEVSVFLSIFAQHLHFTPDQEGKLQKLFLLKDLRLGKLARRNLLCSLIKMAGEENGEVVVKRLIDISTLSKDDPKRLRTIFRLKEATQVRDIIDGSNTLLEAKNRVVDRASKELLKRIGILDEEAARLDINIEYFVISGLLSSYSALFTRYQKLPGARSQVVLQEVYRQIIEGNFREWRSEHDESKSQLAIVDPRTAQLWLNALQPMTAEIIAESELELAETIKRGISEMALHLSFDFEKGESIYTAAQVDHNLFKSERTERELEEATKIYKVSKLMHQVKKYDLEFGSKEQLVALIGELRDNLQLLNQHQAVSDLSELIRGINARDKISGDVVTAQESDDPVQLLNSGVFPRETCQSWRGGMYNEGLMSTVADANKRIVNITDGEGRICGRAIIKLVSLEDEEGEAIPAVLLEPIYTLKSNSSIDALVLSLALAKAKVCGLPLAIGDSLDPKSIPNPQTKDTIFSRRTVRLSQVSQTGEFEYSDTFNGRITDETVQSSYVELTFIESGGEVEK